MIVTKEDFLNARNGILEVDTSMSYIDDDFLLQSPVKSIPNVEIKGSLHYDASAGLVTSDLELEGTMIVEDSITLEDLEVDFETKSQETYSFEPIDQDDFEIIVAENDTINIDRQVMQAVIYEAPMNITRCPRDQYPKGDGWQVVSDQDPKEEKNGSAMGKIKRFQIG